MSLLSSIARIGGPGTASEGVGHWRMQRLTAVALIPLTLWFVVALLGVVNADYEAVVTWIGSPINTILLIALMVGIFYHAILGMQVVIEDYVHVEKTRALSLLAMKGILAVLGGASVLAILIIAFGG